MKKYFLLINVIVGFSCNSTIRKEAVIPAATMIEVLIDIHILEARVDKLRLPNDSSYAIYNTLEKEIFEKHDVVKTEYERSYQYYLSNPKALDQIYAVVVDSLNVIQKRGYQEDTELTLANVSKPSLDSIAKQKEEVRTVTIPRDSLLKK